MSKAYQRIVPAISTTGLTCGTTAGSKTVTSSAAFASVEAGQRVVGAGIPFGTVVASKETSSSITLSKPASATSASVTLQFGYFTSAAYAAGDALGFPFEVTMSRIDNVIVVDAAKQITAVKLLFFSDTFIETADNAAFGISDADAAKIIGYLSLATSEVFANNQIVTGSGTQLPITLGGKTYCQLIVVGSPTFLAVDGLTVNLMGE